MRFVSSLLLSTCRLRNIVFTGNQSQRLWGLSESRRLFYYFKNKSFNQFKWRLIRLCAVIKDRVSAGGEKQSDLVLPNQSINGVMTFVVVLFCSVLFCYQKVPVRLTIIRQLQTPLSVNGLSPRKVQLMKINVYCSILAVV